MGTPVSTKAMRVITMLSYRLVIAQLENLNKHEKLRERITRN